MSASDTDKKVSDAMENAGLFFWILKSMKQFNDGEINGIITGQLKTTERENCFIMTYWRAITNVDSMLCTCRTSFSDE
jgi:hypothetical protein